MGHPEVMSTSSPGCDMIGGANESEVVIGGEKCLALVDSGSMVTSVGEDFYHRHLQDKYPLQELSDLLYVEGAGGHMLEYRGYLEVDIAVPGHGDSPLWVPVLVASSTTYNQRVPMIIGTNVLRNLLPNSSGDVWSLASKAVVGQETVVQESSVYCLRHMVIAPNHTVNFKGRVGVKRGMGCGVLEPVDSLPGGLMMTQSTVEPDENNNVPVVLRNVTSRSIEIPPRQKIAVLQSATVLASVGQHHQEEDSTDVKEIDVSIEKENLSNEELEQVQKMLRKWENVFAHSSTELGLAKGVKHGIQLSDNVPFKDKPRRVPPAMYDEVKQHLQDMLACKAIRPSCSPYNSNIVLVRKKDGSLRICIDYRKLNSKTVKDAYMMPRIDETLDSLHGATWFSCLDLQAGYWQIELEEQDKAKTAFSVGSNLGFYEWNRMAFGLTNAPATFQRLMENTLKDLPNCFAYLDDVIIYSSGSVSDHLSKLEQVFRRLQEHGLKLKPKKCHLLRRKIKYLVASI